MRYGRRRRRRTTSASAIPNEGQPATERTEIRVLYDDNALYVGARMFDSAAGRDLEAIDRAATVARLPTASRILLDPRHDHRTGVQFTVSAAGVQGDGVISERHVHETTSWDAVWSSAVSHDDQGWSAELRIPFSQLRFNEDEHQTWGINASRFIRRKNETAWLEFWPEERQRARVADDAPRRASTASVRGGDWSSRPTRPRVRSSSTRADGDPFNDGSRMFGSLGVDVKASVKGGLVLDATINPDFGQAEVDPAVVNLSAYETFFQEKRRFFIEGRGHLQQFRAGRLEQLLRLQQLQSGHVLFAANRAAAVGGGRRGLRRYAARHDDTRRGKADGQDRATDGASVSSRRSRRASASRHATGSMRDRTLVEPATNYFVARLQRDFTRGGAGFLTTSVLRDLDTALLKDTLPNRAFVFGGDAYYFFDSNKDWVVTGSWPPAMSAEARRRSRIYNAPRSDTTSGPMRST